MTPAARCTSNAHAYAPAMSVTDHWCLLQCGSCQSSRVTDSDLQALSAHLDDVHGLHFALQVLCRQALFFVHRIHDGSLADRLFPARRQRWHEAKCSTPTATITRAIAMRAAMCWCTSALSLYMFCVGGAGFVRNKVSGVCRLWLQPHSSGDICTPRRPCVAQTERIRHSVHDAYEDFEAQAAGRKAAPRFPCIQFGHYMVAALPDRQRVERGDGRLPQKEGSGSGGDA
jgi:hypothetical protein